VTVECGSHRVTAKCSASIECDQHGIACMARRLSVPLEELASAHITGSCSAGPPFVRRTACPLSHHRLCSSFGVQASPDFSFNDADRIPFEGHGRGEPCHRARRTRPNASNRRSRDPRVPRPHPTINARGYTGRRWDKHCCPPDEVLSRLSCPPVSRFAVSHSRQDWRRVRAYVASNEAGASAIDRPRI
jgi:hypothetical protein